jgi:predicted Zn-ribbon and HTH transcriptional regulator
MIVIRVVECEDCGHRYELRSDSVAAEQCPICGSQRSILIEDQYEYE